MQIRRSYQFYLNMNGNEELLDPLCDSVIEGLALVELNICLIIWFLHLHSMNKHEIFNNFHHNLGGESIYRYIPVYVCQAIYDTMFWRYANITSGFEKRHFLSSGSKFKIQKWPLTESEQILRAFSEERVRCCLM